MFHCNKCRRSSEGSPTVVIVSQRHKEYSFLDVEGNPATSIGREIVKEQKWCSLCSGRPPKAVDDGGYEVNMRGASAAHNHSRRCNKKIEDCTVCQQIQRFFSLLPPHHAAEALSEPLTVPASFSFGTLILDSTFVRGCDKGDRAMRDKAAGMLLLRQYEEAGGKLSSASH